MKSQTMKSITAAGFLAAIAMAQTAPPKYAILDLGAIGGAGYVNIIGNNGLIAGSAVTPNNNLHSVVWFKGLEFDFGPPSLGGLHSAATAINGAGQAVGVAQTTVPNGEDFCGFNAFGLTKSSTSCVPFVWQNGVTTKLPTLGGANGVANSINNQGQAAGWAETAFPDASGACAVAQFLPVIWGKSGVTTLSPYPGDTDGVAWAINDSGQAVGASGSCTSFSIYSNDSLLEKHPMLWIDGVAINLGTLGGTGAGSGNHACALNNRGQVVGHTDLKGDETFHGFVWSAETGMQDIGTLPGDYASLTLGINDQGALVGVSLDQNFNSRAILLQNGAMTDLNTIVSSNPQKLYLAQANSINASGEIVGLAADAAGNLHGFLATPATEGTNSPALETVAMPALSSEARKVMFRRMGIRGK